MCPFGYSFPKTEEYPGKRGEEDMKKNVERDYPRLPKGFVTLFSAANSRNLLRYIDEFVDGEDSILFSKG